MSDNLELTQILIAKFSHDLAGTIGAVSNAVEFLIEDNALLRKRAAELVSVSSEHAIANLRFFREAYGISKNIGETNFDDIRQLCAMFLQCNSKITLEFQQKHSHKPEIFIGLGVGKLVLCVVSVAATTLLHGGIVRVSIEKISNNAKIIVSSHGFGLKVNKTHHDILSGRAQNTAISTLNVHYHYTRMLIEQLGAKLVINDSADKVEYIIE